MLRWLGYVEGILAKKISKHLLYGKPDRRGKKGGQHQLSWLGNVKDDICQIQRVVEQIMRDI